MRRPRGRCRVVVVGTGHPLMGDDAAGLAAARLLREALPPGLRDCVLECPMGPEHCVDLVRGLGPGLVVVVDAALGLGPGELVWAEAGSPGLQEWLPSTHNIPPRLLKALMGGVELRFLLIGVERVEPGLGLSPAARRGAREAARELARLLLGGSGSPGS